MRRDERVVHELNVPLRVQVKMPDPRVELTMALSKAELSSDANVQMYSANLLANLSKTHFPVSKVDRITPASQGLNAHDTAHGRCLLTSPKIWYKHLLKMCWISFKKKN